jgi:hypothetical protein
MRKLFYVAIAWIVFGCASVKYEPVFIGKKIILTDENTDPEIVEAIYLGLEKKVYVLELVKESKIALDLMIDEVGGIDGNVLISVEDMGLCPKGVTHQYYKVGHNDCEITTSLYICINMPEIATQEFKVIDYALLVSPSESCDE